MHGHPGAACKLLLHHARIIAIPGTLSVAAANERLAAGMAALPTGATGSSWVLHTCLE